MGRNKKISVCYSNEWFGSTHTDLSILVINSMTSTNVTQFVNICLSVFSGATSASKDYFIPPAVFLPENCSLNQDV